MARFRGTVQGSRKRVSRLGSAASGVTVTANGWGIGALVQAVPNRADKDVIRIAITGGSNDPHRYASQINVEPYGDGRLQLTVWRKDGSRAFQEVIL